MIKKFIDRIIKAIFPNSCLICNRIIVDGKFCIDDWNKLKFLQKPACDICFHPFEFAVEDQTICGKCLQHRPLYFKALAVLSYDEFSKGLITKFKYFDQTNLAKYFAKIMFGISKEIFSDVDFIAPIPLHKLRLIKRKYNQGALLAKNIGVLSGKKTLLDLLIRTKNNKPQAGLNQKMRVKNVQGIFSVKEKYFSAIKGKNILLIDDVITTGSTAESCCKALLKAGAKRVYVLALAKTVID